MAALENPVKDDSSSEAEDVSESAKLVDITPKGSISGSSPVTDGPLLKSPKKTLPKEASNGTVLTGTAGEDMDESLEDHSETAKLLGGSSSSSSREKLVDGGAGFTKTSPTSKEVVKETKRKLIKVDQGGDKTEIIIERSETVRENFTNVERSSTIVSTETSTLVTSKDVKDKSNVSEKGEDGKDKEEGGEKDVDTKKDASEFENEKDVEDKKMEQILLITDAIMDQTTRDAPLAAPEVGGDEAGSEMAPSDGATDSYEQDTDTYDLYQTVGSMTPNSLSNADVFRSLAATVASSQATFISAEDALGPHEDVPASPRSPLATELSARGSPALLESVELSSREVEAGQSTPRVETEDGQEDDGGQTRQASQEHTEDEDTQREVTFEEASGLAPVVMYPAQVHQYCPPGLEGLLDCGQLVIHKENLRHNMVFNSDALNRMEVIDISRKVLFYVEEETPPLSEKSFLFKVYNRNKQEVMQIYNPQSTTCIGCGASWHCFRKCHFQTLVFAPLGQVAGFVKRSHTYFVQEYLVLNSQEDVMLIMRGGPDDLEIYTPDLENELGRLAVHHWHGIMHEVRRSHSDYGITFPIDLDVRVKAVLLGAVFALDWMYSTRGGRRR